MKNLFTLFISCVLSFGLFAQTPVTFHDYSAVTLSGDTVNLSQYYGKKIMVVNCASFCQYTPQYAPLQQLYDQYHQYNFEILGFPSDDFLNQGGTDSEIIHTCSTYGVTFPIMNKIHVSAALYGNAVDPVFQWLEKSSLNGVSNATVTWNFNKFLVDEAGHWVRYLDSPVDPLDTAITNWIMSPSVVSGISSLSLDNAIELKSANPTASSIDFVIKNSEAEHYNIKIFSEQGQYIGTIYDGIAAAQNVSYSTSNLASGLYFISVRSNDAQKTFRCSVLR